MRKEKERDWNNVVVSVRLKDADATRFWTLVDIVKEKNSYADRSDIVRELLGLDKLHLVTEADAEYFRTGEKSAKPATIKHDPSAPSQPVKNQGAIPDFDTNSESKTRRGKAS